MWRKTSDTWLPLFWGPAVLGLLLQWNACRCSLSLLLDLDRDVAQNSIEWLLSFKLSIFKTHWADLLSVGSQLPPRTLNASNRKRTYCTESRCMLNLSRNPSIKTCENVINQSFAPDQPPCNSHAAKTWLINAFRIFGFRAARSKMPYAVHVTQPQHNQGRCYFDRLLPHFK